ncbi:MAG: hypothetical protein JWQ66_2935 [Mucilaginibacter sp.]|nr:hypothetical protein [Mucilaginibacter sp.]
MQLSVIHISDRLDLKPKKLTAQQIRAKALRDNFNSREYEDFIRENQEDLARIKRSNPDFELTKLF